MGRSWRSLLGMRQKKPAAPAPAPVAAAAAARGATAGPTPAAYSGRPGARDRQVVQPLESAPAFLRTGTELVDFTRLPQAALDEGMEEFELRSKVLEYMDINDGEYAVLLTADAAAALELVASCFPFTKSMALVTAYEHHQSGATGFLEAAHKHAREAGTRVAAAPISSWLDMSVNGPGLRRLLVGDIGASGGARRKEGSLPPPAPLPPTTSEATRGLFVLPSQARVSGLRDKLDWIVEAHNTGWHVLLDGTDMSASDLELLDLHSYKPDFVACSFSKVFQVEVGYPFGALLVKKGFTLQPKRHLQPLADHGLRRFSMTGEKGSGLCYSMTGPQSHRPRRASFVEIAESLAKRLSWERTPPSAHKNTRVGPDDHDLSPPAPPCFTFRSRGETPAPPPSAAYQESALYQLPAGNAQLVKEKSLPHPGGNVVHTL
eukprot:SM000008S22180  [mRNA]  locus=s8:197096:199202:- [translate_table: standard]